MFWGELSLQGLLELGIEERIMTKLTVETIPTRNWKQKLDKHELKKTYLKLKNKNPYVENRKVHYLWFNYLKLCMNLEKIGYLVQRKRKGISKPPVYEEETKVEVNKEIYKGWSLDSLYQMKFHEWYSHGRNFNLFSEGRFEVTGKPKYQVLIRRFNVFIDYHNGMDNFDYSRGDMTKRMKVSEDILKVHQKERFDELTKFRTYESVVLVDVKNCENIILSVCQGRFPK